MNDHIEIAFLLLVIFSVTVLLLWLTNIKDRLFRYHQFLSAVFAPFYAVIIYLIYTTDAFPELFLWLESFWEEALDTRIQSLWLDALLPFSFFLLALLVYIPLKRLLIWLLQEKKIFDPSPAISLGVYEQQENRILLKNDYYYPLKYMYASVIVFSIVYSLSFFSFGLGAPFPAFGLLLVFISLEFFWFLNGKSELGEFDIKPVSLSNGIDFYSMWKDYQETWPDNLSLAFIKKSRFTEWAPSDIDGEMLIKNYKKNAIFQKIHKQMVDLLNKGKKIIIFIPDNYQPLAKLEESEKYKIIKELLFGFDFTSQFVTTEVMDLKLESSIFITSIDKFLLHSTNLEEDTELHNWFKNLRLVLYFGYDISLIESPESSVSASSIIKYLSENPGDLISIVFAEDREAQQASWKSNLKTNPQRDREIKINDSESENTYYLGWKGEKRFEAGLFNRYANRYIGPLASLVGLPYTYDMKSVDVKPNRDPFVDNYENTIEDKDDWQDRYRKLQLLVEKDLLNYVKVHHHNLSLSHSDDKALIIYDNYHNAPFLYKYFSEFGKKNNLLNIVSPPHILREYFNDNFEYFSKNPIKPLSYVLIAGDKSTLALALLEKLVKCKLTLRELAQDFSEIENNQQIVITQLRDLFNETYNFDIIDTSYLIVTESRDGELLFSLKTDIKDQIELFKKVRFVDTNNNEIFIRNKNLLFQKYLIGQTHTFGGRMFTIRRIVNIENDIMVRVENTEPKQHFSYMEKREIRLSLRNDWKKIESKNPTNEYALNIYTKSFSVSTSGYFELNAGNSLAKGKYTFHSTKDIGDRNYKYGRVCKISFANYLSIPKFGKANMTLRVALEEVIKVLFPDSFHYLIVRCFGDKKSAPDNIISNYYCLKNQLESEELGQAGIYIFEDSIFDMGHLKSIIENIDYILKIIDDYFSYVIEKTKKQKISFKQLEESTLSQSDYFLSYELKRIKALEDFPDPIDIQSAKNLTGKCLRLPNDITYDRRGKKIPAGPTKLTFEGDCHSCRKKACNEHNSELLEDGRIICNSCKSKNKRTIIEQQELVGISRQYFEQFQMLPVISSIKFTTLKEINPESQFQSNISRFPYATVKVTRNSGDYHIYIENFRNKLETCTSLLQAFTHVWQMENINVEKLKEETHHLEGHAMMIMEKFLTSNALPLGPTINEANKLLGEIKAFRSQFFQNALEKLNQEAENKDLFFYLSMNYDPPGNQELELIAS